MPGFKTWGFDDFGDYTRSLKAVYKDLTTRAISPVTPLEEVVDTPLPRHLTWLHVSALGVGLILGAGIFVSTGEAAANIAGPAVILSFMVAGASAILSTLCYSEFAVRFPLSGGAFNYLLFSCGELVAFCCVCTLILEYVLANAAVARSFAPYFGQLVGKGSEFFVFKAGAGVTIDPLGAGLVFICVLLVCTSTEHSNTTNLIITVVHVVVVLMIAIVGFTRANKANLTPFIPPEHGVRGIFEGASFVFFSFIGFDCVSTMAEEVKKPSRDMPIGIVSCIVIVTCIYVLMALSLVLMVPYTEIDPAAAFAAAFQTAGMPWMRVIVAIGALLGIVTGVLVGSMAVSRIFSAVGRAHLVIPVLGRVHHRFKTPFLAALVLGVPTAVLALVSDLPMLVNLVSAGTLFVFGMVALALIIKRYTLDPEASRKQSVREKVLRALFIGGLCGSALCLGVVYNLDPRFWTYLIIIAIHFIITICLHTLVPQAPKPDYTAPLFPYVPSASLLINAWLCSTLPAEAWIQYAIFLAIIAAVYFVYSAASSLALQEHSALAKGGVKREPSEIVRVISAPYNAPGGGLMETDEVGVRVLSSLNAANAAKASDEADGARRQLTGLNADAHTVTQRIKDLEGKKAVELV